MKKIVVAGLLIGGLVLAFVAPGWLEEHPIAAASIGVGGALMVVGLALALGVVIGGAWTRRTMADGAEIALRAQQVNDEWDAKKTAAFTSLLREGASIGRQVPNLPALPLPIQGETFLPPLVEFKQANWQVIDGDSEKQ